MTTAHAVRRSTDAIRVPAVLPVITMTISADGTMTVAVDGTPFEPPRFGPPWARASFAEIIDTVLHAHGSPVRVVVHEADGTVFTDLITRPLQGSVAPSAPPQVRDGGSSAPAEPLAAPDSTHRCDALDRAASRRVRRGRLPPGRRGRRRDHRAAHQGCRRTGPLERCWNRGSAERAPTARSSSSGESPARVSSGSSHDGSPRCRCLRSRRADQRRVARSRRGRCDRRHPACGRRSRRLLSGRQQPTGGLAAGLGVFGSPADPGAALGSRWAQPRGVLGCRRCCSGAARRSGVVGVAVHAEPGTRHAKVRPEPDRWGR